MRRGRHSGAGRATDRRPRPWYRPGDELDHGCHLVTRRDLEKPSDRARSRAGLVIWMAQPCNSTTATASKPCSRRPQSRPRGAFVEGDENFARSAHPFVDLDDGIVQHRRQDDVAREDVGPRLVTDAKRVGEASRDPRAVRSPLRSRRALVATVVPIRTAPSDPPSASTMRRMPSSAASSYCRGWSESSFMTRCSPSELCPTISVNVPPRSMAKDHERFTRSALGVFSSGRAPPMERSWLSWTAGAAGFIGAATSHVFARTRRDRGSASTTSTIITIRA